MPFLSSLFIRTALIYLAAGFGLGGILLASKAGFVGGFVWIFLPLHVEWLFLGWALQLAMGVAYWIVPRDENNRRPRRWLAKLSFGLLNAGLLFSAFRQADAAWSWGWLPFESNPLSSGAILAGVACFVLHLWPRVHPFLVPAKESSEQGNFPG